MIRMSSRTPIIEIEGSWEEILSRSNELSGRQVRVTVLPDRSQAELRGVADQFLADVQRLDAGPRLERSNADRAAYTDALAEKYRAQGLEP
jgi:hypothetical protein